MVQADGPTSATCTIVAIMPETLPWKRPELPPSTQKNDGTLMNMYDVRKTLAYVTEDTGNANNFTSTPTPGVRGSKHVGTFLAVNDLQTMQARGALTLVPGSARYDLLSIKSAPQSATMPEGGDGWTNALMELNFLDVKLAARIQPTGKNFYYGGGGGRDSALAVVARPGRGDLTTRMVVASPTCLLTGTISVDGATHEFDTANSFALFERKWGNFTCLPVHWALWFFLETGEVIISWALGPSTREGRTETLFASAWHPTERHEMLPVGEVTRGNDPSVSSENGFVYWNHYVLDLPARNARFEAKKWFRDAGLTAMPAGSRYIDISESYCESMALWELKEVKFFGHLEQYSDVRP
ncbi:hypothetical protein M427DRAFT_70882 [Gonapodya prolifera JEL478]|uniref:AttH domain-containing protein n=1 Tax=Gonapodya prolifera (strain JEL478) TaxID=1344416 RepID=A0A139AC15_GONPJ|nr:hypothetical protein M427DRAFT_70882 [Gonapodya prolifera JEL478]|eukprot:KXS13963.1 hypothetical protein M427DRAFT_70882 [Gonapodya prolifera JEL478]